MKLMKYTLLGILVFFSCSAIAQDNHKFPKLEELHERKWQSLVAQAQLTQKEIEMVKPVFMEYEQSVWKLHRENREFFKSSLTNAKTNKPNYAELNDRYVEYEFKEAQLFKSYHLQLRKLMQPETLFRYYKAEREFKRKLLQDFQERKLHDMR
ncbi:MAG: hypothetical protein Q8904_04595 [Bacteroidota bacterium]|nr:hypothetical protein [Bacteroidota bacterium]